MFTFLNKITFPFDDPWESYPDSLFSLYGSIDGSKICLIKISYVSVYLLPRRPKQITLSRGLFSVVNFPKTTASRYWFFIQS